MQRKGLQTQNKKQSLPVLVGLADWLAWWMVGVMVEPVVMFAVGLGLGTSEVGAWGGLGWSWNGLGGVLRKSWVVLGRSGRS